MARLKLKGRTSVSVTEIWANITCPNCSHTYDVQMKGSKTFKTCRCSEVTIGFKIASQPGELVVTAAYISNAVQEETPLTINKVYVEGDEE